MDGDQSGHGSESKVLVGKKRGFTDVEESSNSSEKRMKKMRDLESVFRSEAHAIRGGTNTAPPDMHSDSRELDLNVNVSSVSCLVGNDNPACVDESNNNIPISEKRKDSHMKARAFDLDLNSEDISSSINDPFFPYKNYERLKSRDELECGSSIGPLDEKDSMRVWKGLKQNNYMSTLHGLASATLPKPRGRKKTNNDAMKKKIELAKKEQVDRFARVAAPSGLLNGLNPGIINHVRNSKQVHSIIEALVKSERTENQLPGRKKFSQIKNGAQEEMMSDYGLFSKMVYPNTEIARGDGDSYMGHTRIFSKIPSQYNVGYVDDKLALKLASSVMVGSENTSCLSNDESANLGSVNSLSFKAANVASQWLDLLNQDIRGRLAALRRSKKRVGAVITTELPLLMSTEFSSTHFDRAAADAHSARWNTLFEQMDKALSEEEIQLESWLNQVKEMQLHCEKGLYRSSLYHASQQTGPIGNDNRSRAADKLERDLAVRAAAASIYSTCNFLLSMENC